MCLPSSPHNPQVLGHFAASHGLEQCPFFKIFSQCLGQEWSLQTSPSLSSSSSSQASQVLGHLAAAHGLEQSPFFKMFSHCLGQLPLSLQT